MSDEEYLSYREPESDVLDSEFRIVLVKQNFNKEEESKGNVPEDNAVEESDLEERLLSSIKTFTEINCFFDKFDSEVAYPNESNIKYDVGSDGLIVIVVNNDDLKATVLKFIDDYLSKVPKQEIEQDSNDDEEKQVKKQKK